MKYVEPVLYVGAYNELRILKDIVEHHVDDCDVLVTHSYQEKHLKLLNKHVNRELYDMIKAYKSYKKTYRKIRKSGWVEDFTFILVKYLQEHDYNKKTFKDWLKNCEKPKLTFMKPKPIRHWDLRRHYDTIVVDLEWGDGNRWNRFYNLTPSYVNKESIVNKCFDYLREQGKVIFVSGKYSQIVGYTIDDFEKMNDNVYKRLPTLRKKFIAPRVLL